VLSQDSVSNDLDYLDYPVGTLREMMIMQKLLFFLSELTDLDVEWLLQAGRQEEVSAGTVLIHEGQPVNALYVLLDGTSVVTISAFEGRQLACLAAGDVMGELSFIDSYPPAATVQTLERSIVLAIPRLVLVEKLQTDTAFACRFYRALSMLLSYRLRGMVRQAGQSNEMGHSNEFGRGAIENQAIAQARLEQLLHRLRHSVVANSI
jgi:CRP/FNR family transcriptional regulator, cyclic AMP receptor protein